MAVEARAAVIPARISSLSWFLVSTTNCCVAPNWRRASIERDRRNLPTTQSDFQKTNTVYRSSFQKTAITCIHTGLFAVVTSIKVTNWHLRLQFNLAYIGSRIKRSEGMLCYP